MIIYLAGASGTGKTTIGDMLARHFDIEHHPSVSRSSPYEHGSRQHQIYTEEMIYQTMNLPGVHDRTLLDVYGYNTFNGYTDLNEEMHGKIIEWANSNPLVIYFPIFFEPENDGVRPTDKTVNAVVDSIIHSGLENIMPNRFITVKNEPVEARFESIIKSIKAVR